MYNEPLFECWCVLFSKIIIYKDRVILKTSLGINTQTIPLSRLASVNKKISGLEFETSGGARNRTIQPWNTKNRDKIVDLIFSLINEK